MLIEPLIYILTLIYMISLFALSMARGFNLLAFPWEIANEDRVFKNFLLSLVAMLLAPIVWLTIGCARCLVLYLKANRPELYRKILEQNAKSSAS